MKLTEQQEKLIREEAEKVYKRVQVYDRFDLGAMEEKQKAFRIGAKFGAGLIHEELKKIVDNTSFRAKDAMGFHFLVVDVDYLNKLINRVEEGE
jgi:hypothetical protein